MPHQQVGTDALAGLGHTQAAADQQALAIDPIRLGQGLGDLPNDAQRAPRITANIQQQGKLIAAQPRQLIAGLQLALEARHHLQDQMVTGLVTEGVIGVAKVVQVQVRHGQATAGELAQAGAQQGVKTLAIGDGGQRVLLRQALHGVLQLAVLAHIAQAAAQHIAGQAVAYQPVSDPGGRLGRLLLQQQHGRQAATSGGRQVRRGTQQQAMFLLIEQAAGRLPGRCGNQCGGIAKRLQALAQQRRPFSLGQQD